MTWVFAILTFSPKALYVDETTFSARCSGSGVWARVHSRHNLNHCRT